MEAAGVLVLVVADDDRVVLGDQPPEPDVAVGLAVGEVVGDIPRGPAAVRRGPVELRVGDVRERVDDGLRAGPESVDEGAFDRGRMGR